MCASEKVKCKITSGSLHCFPSHVFAASWACRGASTFLGCRAGQTARPPWAAEGCSARRQAAAASAGPGGRPGEERWPSRLLQRLCGMEKSELARGVLGLHQPGAEQRGTRM